MDGWIEKELPAAVRYAASLIGDRTAAEDIVQEAIYRLLRRAGSYDLDRDGRKLLYRAVTNGCINLTVRRREVLSLNNSSGQQETAPQVVDPRAASPADVVMATELNDAIHRGLQSLSMRDRCVLELASLGHEPRGIADIIGMKPAGIRVILHRARKTMAAFLNAHFSERIVP